MTKRNRAGRWRRQGTLVEMQEKDLAERIENMARKTRAERQAAHRREVDTHKYRIRGMMDEGYYMYAQEHYHEAIRNGEHARAEAIEGMLGEINKHNREHPSPPNYGMDDGADRMRELERRRREARDLERVADIAEGARRKAAGIGGGLYATPEPEPEEEEYDEPDPQAEEYEGRRRALMGHGLVSRTPAPPVQRKRRKKYTPPPFVG